MAGDDTIYFILVNLKQTCWGGNFLINNTFHRKLFYTATKTSENSGIFISASRTIIKLWGFAVRCGREEEKKGSVRRNAYFFFTHARNIRIPFFPFPHYENVLLKCVHLRIGREQRQKEHNFSSALDE